MTLSPPVVLSRRRTILRAACICSAAAGLAPLSLASTPAFPRQALRILVPFAAGGVADLTARVVARHMAQTLGQSVVVDNRPGAGGVVATSTVVQAKPDGHTLLLLSNANAIAPGLFKRLPFDALAELQPVSTLGSFDLAVFVAARSRLTTYADFAAQARRTPGALNVGTVQPGSTQHLAAELLKSTAELDFQVVPFNSSPALYAALRGGQLDASVEIISPMMAHVQAGAARALLVTHQRRASALPSTPSALELGMPGLVATSWNALAVPAATPAAVVERLQQAVAAALADAQVLQQLRALYVEPRASSPAQAQLLLREETQRWGTVIRQAGLQPQG